VTRLPQLEAQLVAAAAGRPRARRPLLIGAGVLAVAACLLAALLLAPASEPQRRERPVTVPETVPAATLVQARALAQLPRPRDVNLRADQLAATARQAMVQVPYPPGMSDHYDWFAHRGSIVHTSAAVQANVEYRAYCMWITYWVRGADRAGAAAVLEQTPHWPMLRQKDNHLTYWQNKIQTALRKHDTAVLRAEAVGGCQRAG
jgi:hypothetical protein